MPIKPIRRRGQAAVEPDEILPPEQESTPTGGPGVGTAAAVGGTALLALVLKNPQAAKEIARKGFDYANAARMTSMLSGLAPVKSALGNVGGVVNMAGEKRSLEPLKQFFSRQTAKDVVSELRNPTTEISKATAEGARVGNPIGRAMGALDTATQNAMKRAGATGDEAAAQLLQTPLPPAIGHALNSRAMQVAVPFRRTPFNQFLEAGRMTRGDYGDPLLKMAHGAAGATTGAASSDEKYPMMPALYSAFAGRYSGPAVLGALAARKLAGGKDTGGMVSSLLPVSEYGVSSSIEDPLKPLTPDGIAAVRVLKRLQGEQ
jgi:hypothetical protein